MSRYLLTVNAGSSSLKLAVFDAAPAEPQAVLRARIETRGRPRRLTVVDNHGRPAAGPPLRLGHRTSRPLVPAAIAWFEAQLGSRLAGVGHRVVHGGDFPAALPATEEVLQRLADLAPLAPLHQSAGLAAVAAVRRARPDLPQAVVFDTAFHRGHSPVVDRLSLPERVTPGLRRFGFHGLSYEHVAERLGVLDPQAAAGRVIVAHLGSGASLCALHGGRSVDTTMGATPLDGLVMATRCGSLDPGVVLWLQQTAGYSAPEVEALLYRRSGLLGVSGVSGDMRTLLASEAPAAHAAVELFVFRIVREVGALAATLGGLDGLVFTGGIGENAPEIRARVCGRLGWLGVRLAKEGGGAREAKLGAEDSRVAVWSIATDEERMIARHARGALDMTGRVEPPR